MLIGLAGKRTVGKSKLAGHLVEHYGFSRVHPFDGGKAACRGYFMYLGADAETAMRMTDGDLKDVPSPFLPQITNPEHGPVGAHYAPRYYMEKSGQFHGVQLGSEWTIGAEPRLQPALRDPAARYVVESIVYEATELRRLGGTIIRVDRPGAEGPQGLMTDKATAMIVPDHVFLNDVEGLDALFAKFEAFLEERLSLTREIEDYVI